MFLNATASIHNFLAWTVGFISHPLLSELFPTYLVRLFLLHTCLNSFSCSQVIFLSLLMSYKALCDMAPIYLFPPFLLTLSLLSSMLCPTVRVFQPHKLLHVKTTVVYNCDRMSPQRFPHPNSHNL